MTKIFDSVCGLIGRTPIVKLKKVTLPNVDMYVKCEFMNPGGSVKDRLALAVVLDAEKRGALTAGQTVVEATSGNTGISLAMVCASRGYPFVAVMTETFSVERRQIMRMLGAKVVLTPAAEKGTGMVRLAKELSEQRGWFLADQFSNFANPRFHAQSTAAEILDAFRELPLDVWVTGYGSAGTISGASPVLKAARPDLTIVVAEPEEAAQLAGNSWNPHRIQGWSPDFIPRNLSQYPLVTPYDVVQPVNDFDAINTAKRLAAEEGLLVGISAGATVAAAIRYAKTLPQHNSKRTSILCMLPDTSERYISTLLYKDIKADESDELC